MNNTPERASVYGPRERVIDVGAQALSDGELVAILLGTGCAGAPAIAVANALLAEVGGLQALLRLGAAAIAVHPGVGPAKSLRLIAALEIGVRTMRRELGPRPRLDTSRAVADEMRARVATLEHEEMWVLALDGQSGLRAARCVARGGLHGCSVAARDILRCALREAASAIVLVHNHPSGDPTPSYEDVTMTRSVASAADVVGMTLVDHVIIAGERHTSLLDLGLHKAD